MSWIRRPDYIFLTTSLAAYLDRKLLVMLLDGRNLIGTLRSFDQHSNIVLEKAFERVIVGNLYCDKPMGLFIARGESVFLIGELDFRWPELPPHMAIVSLDKIKAAEKAERESSVLKGTVRKWMEFLDDIFD